MKTRFALCLLGLATATSLARADDVTAQPRRPHERFSDGQKTFERVRSILLKEYVDEVSEDDLYRAAVAGMVAGAGDRPWDQLLSPREMAELKNDLAGEVVGIGVQFKFEPESGITTVVEVLPGSPAEKGGLVAGDKILKVDGRSLKGKQQRDVLYSIRGKAGTQVALTVLRDDKIFTRSLERAPMAIDPVSELALPNQAVLLTIRAFNEKTPSLLRAALRRIAGQPPRALVVDLRDNAGGLFEKMLDCTSLLVPKGSLVVTQVGRGGREEAIRTKDEPVLVGVPMAVLIDSATASGAEMMAGALKKHAGAHLVGKRSHGKWNAQRIADLPNQYALKFTVGVFKSAGGELLDGKGLEPEIEVEMDPAAVGAAQRVHDGGARVAADAQLRAALAVLRLTH